MKGASRATPLLVSLRAGLLAVVVVGASSVGHLLAGGLLPGPGAMALLVLATAVLAAGFLGHQASAPRVVSLLVAGQAVVHLGLSALAGHRPAVGPGGHGGPGGDGGHGGAGPVPPFDGSSARRSGSYFDQVDAMQAGPLPGTAGPGTAGPDTADPSALLGHLWTHVAAEGTRGLVMVLAHLVVVVALGLWLAAGERALWAVLVLVSVRLQDLVLPGVVRTLLGRPGGVADLLLDRARRGLVLRSSRRDAVPLPHLLHHVVAHRGPPALLVA